MTAFPPLIYLWHDVCGKPAYLIKRTPKAFHYLDSKDVLLLSGHPVPPLSFIRCQSCGKGVFPKIRNVHP